MDPFSNFEWDDNKRRVNVAKHGVDFVDATEVFADPEQFTYRSPHRNEEAVHFGRAGAPKTDCR